MKKTLQETLRNSKKLLIGGHRGHQCEVRENTISNFELLKGLSISHLEVDVQLSKDKQAVVYHDIELSQKTVLSGMIRDYTFKELKDNFEVHTLEEVIAYCIKEELLLAIEIKTRHIVMHNDVLILMEKINEIIKAQDFAAYCFVFSVDYRALNYLKTMNQNINIGLIVPHIPTDPVRLMQEMQAIIYLTYIDNLSQEIVDKLHAAGFYVDGSVINSEQKIIQAIKMRLDMIESDYPKAMLGVIE